MFLYQLEYHYIGGKNEQSLVLFDFLSIDTIPQAIGKYILSQVKYKNTNLCNKSTQIIT